MARHGDAPEDVARVAALASLGIGGVTRFVGPDLARAWAADRALIRGDELRSMMRRHWHQLPCLLVSFGQPYYLYDAPRMPCVINANTAIEPVQRAVLARLLGDAPFTGISPVDASCSLPDAMH